MYGRAVAQWWWKADLFESCNRAEFACGCNYTSVGFSYAYTWGVLSSVSYNAPWPDPVIASYDD